MSSNTYDIGDAVVLVGRFSDPVTGEPITPTNVKCTVQPPGGGEVQHPDVELVDDAYEASVSPDVAGTWQWRMAGTDSDEHPVAAGPRRFRVRAPNVPLD